jgi:hypothetical protein
MIDGGGGIRVCALLIYRDAYISSLNIRRRCAREAALRRLRKVRSCTAAAAQRKKLRCGDCAR